MKCAHLELLIGLVLLAAGCQPQTSGTGVVLRSVSSTSTLPDTSRNGTAVVPTTSDATLLPYRAAWTSTAGASIIAASSSNATRTRFFSELARKSINVAIVEGTAALKNNRPSLKAFVEDARAHGVRVEVLMNFGKGRGTITQNGTIGAEYAGYVKTYQQTYCVTGSENACLLAFHIDFEPYGFPEWIDRWVNENSVNGFPRTAFLDALTTIYNALGGRAPLNADLPHWFENADNTNSSGVTLLKKIYDCGVQTAYIMNYTDIQSTARTQVSRDISIACSFPANNPRFVVSLADVENEPSSSLTFYNQGWTPVNDQWSALNTQYSASPCWRGNGVFEFDGMSAM